MALTRQQKSAQLKDLTARMQQAKSVVFTHYIGLKVSEISELRRKLKLEKAEMKVSKKSLIRLAAKEANAPALDEKQLTGDIACIFSNDDPLSGARIAFAYGKDHPHVKLTGGIFEGKILSEADAKSFALLPSRQVLLATFAVMLRTPLTQFASAIGSPLSGFARALAELAKKRESQSA